MTATIKAAGRNLAALIGLFAVHLVAFIACTTLFSAGAGLIVIFVGLFVLVAGLVVAGWSARMTRALLAYAGVELPPTVYPAPGPGVRASCAGWPMRSRGGTCCMCWWLRAVHDHLLDRADLGGRRTGRADLLVLEPVAAGQQPGLPATCSASPDGSPTSRSTPCSVRHAGLTTPIVLRGLVGMHAAVARALLVDETSALRAAGERADREPDRRRRGRGADPAPAGARPARRAAAAAGPAGHGHLGRAAPDGRRPDPGPGPARRGVPAVAGRAGRDPHPVPRHRPADPGRAGAGGGGHRARRPRHAYRPRSTSSRSSASPTPRRTPPTS